MYKMLANISFQNKNLLEAKKLFEKALILKPDNQEILYGLVTLQGILTLIGNSTLAISTIAIYKLTNSYE